MLGWLRIRGSFVEFCFSDESDQMFVVKDECGFCSEICERKFEKYSTSYR